MSIFCIHTKLKEQQSSITYLFIASDRESDVKNKLITSYDQNDNMEHALYKRDGQYFILVDFFNEISEACPEAVNIIKNSRFRNQFF